MICIGSGDVNVISIVVHFDGMCSNVFNLIGKIELSIFIVILFFVNQSPECAERFIVFQSVYAFNQRVFSRPKFFLLANVIRLWSFTMA